MVRDIRAMLEQLVDDSELNHVFEDRDVRGYTTCFHLTKNLSMTLVAGYSVKLRKAIVDRWQELEAQLAGPSFKLPDFSNPAAAARAWADALGSLLGQLTDLRCVALVSGGAHGLLVPNL